MNLGRQDASCRGAVHRNEGYRKTWAGSATPTTLLSAAKRIHHPGRPASAMSRSPWQVPGIPRGRARGQLTRSRCSHTHLGVAWSWNAARASRFHAASQSLRGRKMLHGARQHSSRLTFNALNDGHERDRRRRSVSAWNAPVLTDLRYAGAISHKPCQCAIWSVSAPLEQY